MAVSRDYLEAIIWPRYERASESLCQALWGISNPKHAGLSSPHWFNEIIEVQFKSILILVFSSPFTWIVLPGPVPGFSVVVFKKAHGASNDAPQQRLSLKNHSFDQFDELAQLVEKAVVKLLNKTIASTPGDVVELENEDGNVFCFPSQKLHQYLTALGFSPEQIPNLLTIDDIVGF